MFVKVPYLLHDIASFKDTFRLIILLLVQIGKGEMESGRKRVPIVVYVYQTNLEQFQLSSRSNYCHFIAVLKIALLEQNWKAFFVSFQLFSKFDKMLVFGNILMIAYTLLQLPTDAK